MNATTAEHKNKRLPLLARIALALAALLIGTIVALGYHVESQINFAYFSSPSASLGAMEWGGSAIAIYCLLVGVRGRWRLL